MEIKCHQRSKVCAQIQQSVDGLANEERVMAAKWQLHEKRGKEKMQYDMQECKTLEARILAEKTRKESQPHTIQDYDNAEASLRYYQRTLASMVACIRETTRTLQAPACFGRGGTPLRGPGASSSASPMAAS